MLNGKRQEADTCATCSAISADSRKPIPISFQFFRQYAGKKTQLAHCRHAFQFELMVSFFFFQGGGDLIQGKTPGSVLHQLLFFGQLKKHGCLPLIRCR